MRRVFSFHASIRLEDGGFRLQKSLLWLPSTLPESRFHSYLVPIYPKLLARGRIFFTHRISIVWGRIHGRMASHILSLWWVEWKVSEISCHLRFIGSDLPGLFLLCHYWSSIGQQMVEQRGVDIPGEYSWRCRTEEGWGKLSAFFISKASEILVDSLEINSHISCRLRMRFLQFYIFLRVFNEFQFPSIFLQSELLLRYNLQRVFSQEELALPLSSNGLYTMVPFFSQLFFKNVFAYAADYAKRSGRLTPTQTVKAFQALGKFTRPSSSSIPSLRFIRICHCLHLFGFPSDLWANVDRARLWICFR